MLLRIEVAAFHPATPPFVAEGRDTEMAVPVRAMHARFPVSSLWPYSSAAPEDATGRPLAVTLPYGVRTFLDGFASTAIAHSSRPAIAHWLKQPTRVQYGPYLVNPYLALLRVEFTVPRTVASRAVRSYRTLSPLPDPISGPSAVCSLLHWS